MTTITHQQIIDRMEALGQEYSAAYKAEQARLDKERDSLQELCGGLGHTFKKPDQTFAFLGLRRCCVFCGAAEPRNA